MSAGPVLRDIHLPPEPGWWPPAPGWWLLAAVLLVAAIPLFLRWRAAARRRRLRRDVDAAWQAVLQRHRDDTAAAAAALSMLLRRASLRFAPEAATLSGEAWLRHLDGDDASRPFSDGPGRRLLDAPFRREVDADELDGIARLVRDRLQRYAEDTRRRA